MTNPTSPGLNFSPSKFLQVLAAGFRQIVADRLLSWLSPVVSVRLFTANGDITFWLGDGRRFTRATSKLKSARFRAVEIPEALLLWRSVAVPDLSEQEIEDAMRLEANSTSPFALDDLCWGYFQPTSRDLGAVSSVCLSSCKQIDLYLQTLVEKSPVGQQPMLWALRDSASPVLLSEGNSGPIRQMVKRRRGLNVFLLGLALVLGACIALTPVAQMRLRAIESSAALDVMREKTKGELNKRETLQHLAESIKAIQEVTGESVNTLPILSHMTDLLSDETSLFSISVQGTKVSLYGQTPNAAALMQRLSSEPGLKDVRAPVPAIRNPSAKDNFTIEFNLGSTSPKPSTSVSGAKP